jgi:hypothetical protein
VLNSHARSYWWDALLGASVLAVFAYYQRGGPPAGPYSYDEADYMHAASMGFRSNYTDSPSRSVLGLLRVGLRFGTSESNRTGLSEYARSADDVHFYRHWHGALYFHWLALLSPWHDSEAAMRAANLVFPLLTFLAIYAGSLWVFPPPLSRPAGLLAGVLFLWSYPTVVCAQVAPHQLFVLCCTLSLMAAAKVLATGRRPYWYCSVVAAGLSFCTMGVACVLVPVLVLVARLERERLCFDWKFARNSTLALLGTILVVWPAAILKLSLLKTYMFMAYLSLFRKAPWGEVTFADTWLIRFRNSPVEWLLLAACLAACARIKCRGERRVLIPFLSFGGLMLLALLRMKTDSVHYMTPFLPPLLVFTGWTLANALSAWGARAGYLAAAVLCLLVFWNTDRQQREHPRREDPRPRALLAQVREQGLGDKELLVPQGDIPPLHYYFPRTRLKGYVDQSDIKRETAQRRFDAVLYPSYPVKLVAPPD